MARTSRAHPFRLALEVRWSPLAGIALAPSLRRQVQVGDPEREGRPLDGREPRGLEAVGQRGGAGEGEDGAREVGVGVLGAAGDEVADEGEDELEVEVVERAEDRVPRSGELE